MFTTKRT